MAAAFFVAAAPVAFLGGMINDDKGSTEELTSFRMRYNTLLIDGVAAE